MPLLDQPIYRDLYGKDILNNHPVAKWVTENGFYIPCHHGLTIEDIEYIYVIVDSYF